MSFDNNNRPDHRPIKERQPRGWALPLGIAAVVLAAATIIFSAAGPDRTRTTEFNSPNATRTPIEASQPPESGIPPSGRDAAGTAPAETGSPRKSNPAGTQ